jgi:hypothetical protein
VRVARARACARESKRERLRKFTAVRARARACARGAAAKRSDCSGRVQGTAPARRYVTFANFEDLRQRSSANLDH